MTEPISLPTPSLARPRTEVETARQRNVSGTMDLAAERYPFCRRLMASTRLARRDFARPAEFAKLPVTVRPNKASGHQGNKANESRREIHV